MPLQPMRRDQMNQLRIDRYEQNMKCVIQAIYYNAIESAGRTSKTAYNHLVPSTYEFYRNNMSEILKRVQVLFPDSKVSHSILAKGSDEKLYDISKIEDKDLHLVDIVSDNSYIVIDWTSPFFQEQSQSQRCYKAGTSS